MFGQGPLIPITYFLVYLLIINLIGFIVMGWDKFKSKRGYWRTPEKTLFAITAIGGGIGTIAGMYIFRHKTKKLRFMIGFPTLLILDILLIIMMISDGIVG